MSRSHLTRSFLLALLIGCGEKPATDDGAAGGDTGDAGGQAFDDADFDTIIDIHDGLDVDEDGDGVPNFEDIDSDGDTINDKVEAGDHDPMTLPIDSDGDGIEDFLDLDSDNNCVSDADEKNEIDGTAGDTDGDGIRDFADDDNDGDGIKDIYEIGESCLNPDSDGDGTPDYMDEDSDGDGIGDIWESGTSDWNDEPQDTDEDGIPDYLDLDSDDDGITDASEGGVSSPSDEPRDTDGDGFPDYADTDSDGDGLSDWDEMHTFGTDPYDEDTDGDGFSDGGEITAGTDPLDDSDVIEGIYVEVAERTLVEEDFEFELRIQMGDIAFLIDTTCSMSGTADAMANEFSAIVEEIDDAIPDAEYGVATYDDYAYSNYGYSSSGDKPFILRQQITDDIAVVQTVLATDVQIHSGGDSPESSMEALYQAAAGLGYDQNCNVSYDGDTDVLPFLADPSDPFLGTAGQSYDSGNSGGGTIGGFGFRDYALPVLIYATDNFLRDPEAGYGVPGGCPTDASGSDVINAVADLGGYLIGIGAQSPTGLTQMEELASATGSFADTDGDTIPDDPLVFHWTGSDEEFRTVITEAIGDLVNSISFSKVELVVEGDEWGFVTGIDPPYYDNIEPSAGINVLDFTLEFTGVVAATTEDQLYGLTLDVIGDGTVLLDTLDIIVLVPGTNY